MFFADRSANSFVSLTFSLNKAGSSHSDRGRNELPHLTVWTHPIGIDLIEVLTHQITFQTAGQLGVHVLETRVPLRRACTFCRASVRGLRQPIDLQRRLGRP